MKSKLSPVLVSGLILVISGVVFGGFGYYLGSNKSSTAPIVSKMTTYTNDNLGFSFDYPPSVYIKELITNLDGPHAGGGKALEIIAADFTAHIDVAPIVPAADEDNYFTEDQILADVFNMYSLAAKNFTFSLIDVNSDPGYVAAYAKLNKSLIKISFDSIRDKGAAKTDGIQYVQEDLPQSAKDLLASFIEL